MRYALIGCGRIAGKHLAAARAASLEIAAVCDFETGRAVGLLRRCGLSSDGIRCDTDYQAMLREVHPDLVAIATDSGAHTAIALDCLRAGAHVIVEKPMALSLGDADRMIALAKEKGLVLAPCHQNRFNPAVLALRRTLAEGKLGELSHGALTVRWNRGAEYYTQAAWRGRWQSDGGVLMNQCIHGIDLLRWMMGGDPVWVCGAIARRIHPCIEAEDVGTAVIRFGNGALATVEGSANIYPENLEETLSVFGERGTVRLGGAAVNRVEVWRVSGEETPPVVLPTPGGGRDVYGNGHLPLYADVIAAITERRAPFVTAQDGRAALELVLAIYQSHKTGRPVKLPLQNFASSEMEGCFG